MLYVALMWGWSRYPKMIMLKGISPTAANLGIPRTVSKPSTVRASAIITNEETVTVPIHPKRLLVQTRYVKSNVSRP